MPHTPVSIFNDVIGPVMRGPSSSHCAAALRIGRLARALMGNDLTSVTVSFARNGSLATTHETQGSDMGLFGGLLGWEATDPRLPDAAEAIAEAGIRIDIRLLDEPDDHPNTYRLALSSRSEHHEMVAISTGGGMIDVRSIDSFGTTITGGCWETLVRLDTPAPQSAERLLGLPGVVRVQAHDSEDGALLHVQSRRRLRQRGLDDALRGLSVRWRRVLVPVLPVLSAEDIRVPFTTSEDMHRHNQGPGLAAWELAATYEAARAGISTGEVLSRMVDIVRTLRSSLDEGLAGTDYADRLLPCQSGGYRSAMSEGRLLGGGLVHRITLYVSALMEVKSAMGVIVACPTAGACAALPGACLAAADDREATAEETAKAMLVGGLAGVFVAAGSTFAAEVAGCQAECGTASGMAAAALTALAGGTADQAMAATALALQNIFGMTCDPIANRVEAPCLGKNVMAAMNGVTCANMALAGYDPLVPLDEVIEAMDRVGRSLPRELRCTGLGGLSTTPTAQRLEHALGTTRGGN